MTQAASQAAAFYREVARTQRIWTIRDAGGSPAPNSGEARAMPSWSSLARVERIFAKVAADRDFSPVELTWVEFRDKWISGLEKDGILVGINWTGERATGYDLTPAEVRRNIEMAVYVDRESTASKGRVPSERVPCIP